MLERNRDLARRMRASVAALEDHPHVASFVKNDHLGFEIPYVHAGVSHRYLPDFLVKLVADPEDDPDLVRTLIVEVSGGRKERLLTEAKADTARHHWCRAVNNHGSYGRWAYVEITDMTTAASTLESAVTNLYADGFMTGLTD